MTQTRLALHPNQTATDHPELLPLVLLHGFPLDHRMWDDVAALLQDLPLLTPDAPGFHDSPQTSAVGLEHYATYLVEDLAASGYERFALAGLSMGGYTAMALAAQAPETLCGLGLLDTNPTVDSDAARQARLEMAQRADGEAGNTVVAGAWQAVLGQTTQSERPAVVETTKQWLAQANASAVAWVQRSMAQRPDRRKTLAALGGTIPAVVIRGSEDLTCTPEIAQDMAGLLQCDVVTVAGAGHMSALEDPQPVAAALRALWERATK